MAQGQDLTVDRIHGIENILEPDLHLSAASRPRGRCDPAEQHRGNRDRARWRQRTAVERYFVARVSHLGTEMLPVQGHQLLARDEAKPKEDRHRWVGSVLPGALRHVEVGILEYV